MSLSLTQVYPLLKKGVFTSGEGLDGKRSLAGGIQFFVAENLAQEWVGGKV